MSDNGTSILYISHKLQEIAELCDTATVLRKGEVIGEYDPKLMSPKELGEIMVGQPLTTPNRPETEKRKEKLFSFSSEKVESETQFGVTLKNIDFEVSTSEILGIGGVAGNGQDELMQLLIGERIQNGVFIHFKNNDISQLNPRKRRGLGMFITESAKKELVKLERNKFMKGDWPALLKKADQLGIDLAELINKS